MIHPRRAPYWVVWTSGTVPFVQFVRAGGWTMGTVRGSTLDDGDGSFCPPSPPPARKRKEILDRLRRKRFSRVTKTTRQREPRRDAFLPRAPQEWRACGAPCICRRGARTFRSKVRAPSLSSFLCPRTAPTVLVVGTLVSRPSVVGDGEVQRILRYLADRSISGCHLAVLQNQVPIQEIIAIVATQD